MVFPGELCRVLHLEHFNLFPVDDEHVFSLDLHGAGEFTIVRVVFEEMGICFCIGDIVDCHHFHLGVFLQECLQYLPSNPSEPVDCNFQ